MTVVCAASGLGWHRVIKPAASKPAPEPRKEME